MSNPHPEGEHPTVTADRKLAEAMAQFNGLATEVAHRTQELADALQSLSGALSALLRAQRETERR